MKLKSLFFAGIYAMAVAVGFTSCSDDNTDDLWKEGSIIEIPNERAYILNEGSYGNNNAVLSLYNYKTDTIVSGDIFGTQNGARLGDTGQDIIAYQNNLYLVLYGSKYIVKMNGAGVEKARFSFDDKLGQPRYMVGEGSHIYVTTYGGYVAKFNADNLTFVDTVKVGNNPEHIIAQDGKIYCVNSGWGKDNRLSIIDIKEFKKAENVELFYNLDYIVNANGHIYVQGYGTDYSYPVAVYDNENKTYKMIGKGSAMVAYGDMLYVAYTNADWSAHTYETTFYAYNGKKGEVDATWSLKNAPKELFKSSVYGMSINPFTGHLYLLVSPYKADGIVYHFDENFNYVGKFESKGVNPRKIAFLR